MTLASIQPKIPRQEPLKILVIRLGAMGDLIHAGTAAWQAKNACTDRNFELHWLAEPGYQNLLQAMYAPFSDNSSGSRNTTPLIQRVWPYDKKAAGWRGFLALGLQLRQERFDAVVNLHPSFKTWLLSRLTGAPKNVVYRKQKISAQQQKASPERRHAIQDFYEPFRELLRLPALSQHALEKAISLKDLPTDPTTRFPTATPPQIGLIIGVGDKRGNRAWPVTAYQALIEQFLQHTDATLHLFGGKAETATAETLLNAVYPPNSSDGLPIRLFNHCGTQDILSTAALMADCALVIGGDTGPLHLASTLNIPVIGLFGPTAVARTGPAGPGLLQALTHSASSSPTLRTVLTPPSTLACWPCELPQCPLQEEEHLACMKQITPQTVFEACLQVLKH